VHDRNRILQFLEDVRHDRAREFGCRLYELADGLDITIERAEFLVKQMQSAELVSLAEGRTVGEMIVDVGQPIFRGAS